MNNIPVSDNLSSRNKKLGVLVILLLLFSAFASLYSEELNRIALYGALPCAFMFSVLMNNGIQLATKYTKFIIIMYVWLACTCLWALYPDAAAFEMHAVLGCIILIFIMNASARYRKLIPWLYIIYIVWYIGAWMYANTNGLIMLDVSNEYDRMNDAKLNANTMAYFTFYATFITYILGEIVNVAFLRRIIKVIFIFAIPLSFFVAIFTASRQVLLIQIPLILFLLYNRYLHKTKIVYKVVFIASAVVAVCAFLSKAQDMYDDSYLKVRNEESIKDDVRHKLMIDGINVGFDNFFKGVGAGNYVRVSFNKHFSHNTYVELFANTGIIGVSLYIYVLLLFISTQWKRYKETKDKMLLLFCLFGVIYAIDNFFYVFYIDCWLISFFTLVSTHSELYYKEQYRIGL